MNDAGRRGLAQNTLTQEILLATRLRQFFRAVEAGDELAVEDGRQSVCHALWLFLDYLLEAEPTWESRDRWFDDLIRARYGWISPDRFVASGELVWGLRSVAGPQWSDPFSADVVISERRTDTASYCIRLGRRDEVEKSELAFGLYPASDDETGSGADPWAGKADWQYEFRKAPAPAEIGGDQP